MKSAFCIAVLSLIVLLVTPAAAQLESARALHGLGEVEVVVADVHPDARRRGLFPAELRKDIAKRLSTAGVKIPQRHELSMSLNSLLCNVRCLTSWTGSPLPI
jgi:hypothetical protein